MWIDMFQAMVMFWSFEDWTIKLSLQFRCQELITIKPEMIVSETKKKQQNIGSEWEKSQLLSEQLTKTSWIPSHTREDTCNHHLFLVPNEIIPFPHLPTETLKIVMENANKKRKY